MKQSRSSREQIVRILKEHEAGLGAVLLCSKHRNFDTAFQEYRLKYGGMDVSDSRRLKTLEAEKTNLKMMPAEQMMDVVKLQGMLEMGAGEQRAFE